jgi:hypothetical protein
LTRLSARHQPLTHATLDELPDSRTLPHLRSVLVASDALPAQTSTSPGSSTGSGKPSPSAPTRAQKQLLHSYTTWHVLRRLRSRARATPVTQHQAATAKENATAPMTLLD